MEEVSTTRQDSKDKWLCGIFIGMMANSITIFSWSEAFFLLDPGQRYRNMLGAILLFFMIPPILVYGIVLACVRTKHYRLKATAVVLNFTPLLIMIAAVIILGLMGHLPAE